MTEKRFTLEEFGLNFIVNDNGRNLTAKQTVDRLNELFNENKQLRKKNHTLKQLLEDNITQRVEINEACKERWG